MLRPMYILIPRWILLRMRNVSDKKCREDQTIQFMFSKSFPKNNNVFAVICKKYGTARQATDDNIIWHMFCVLDK